LLATLRYLLEGVEAVQEPQEFMKSRELQSPKEFLKSREHTGVKDVLNSTKGFGIKESFDMPNLVSNVINSKNSSMNQKSFETVSGPIELPSFAKGGITPGGSVLVGEEGPEVVALPKGSKVSPTKNKIESKVIINVENHGTESQIEQTQQPDGTVLINLINSVVSESISNGGEVYKALNANGGFNMKGVLR